MKPTYGLVSTAGVVPLGITFDHVGPLARNVTDACILLEAIAGKYPRGAARPGWRTLRKTLPRRFRLGLAEAILFRPDRARRAALGRGCREEIRSTGSAGRGGFTATPRPSGGTGDHRRGRRGERLSRIAGIFPGAGRRIWRRRPRAPRIRAQAARRRLSPRDRRAPGHHRGFRSGVRKGGRDSGAHFANSSAPRVGQTQVRITGDRDTATRAELLRLTRPSNISVLPAISIPCGFTRRRAAGGDATYGPAMERSASAGDRRGPTNKRPSGTPAARISPKAWPPLALGGEGPSFQIVELTLASAELRACYLQKQNRVVTRLIDMVKLADCRP